MWSPFGKRRKSGFARDLVASFPDGLAPPEVLVRFFEWQEANGLDSGDGEERFARLDPNQPDFCMYTMTVDHGHVEAFFPEAVPAERARVAPFMRTGGDGSVAALWRDDSGESAIVCVLTRDPVDFLILLAIGYDELCWPDLYSKTPLEVHLVDFADINDRPYIGRMKLQKWVADSFGVTIPATASEIVMATADMDQPASQDPFWRWSKSMQILDW